MQKTKMANKLMSLIMALALVLTMIPAGGIGVVSAAGNASKFLAPIEAPVAGSIAISTAAQLAAIGKDSDSLSKNYHLTNDIDLSGEWTPIGTSSSPFRGTFDGQGYVIKNLKITGDYQYAGLFGDTSGATIQNVGLEGTYINISSSNSCFAGGIWGSGYGSISNCYNTGDVSASASDNASSYAGGICGFNTSGTISNCYNTGDVSASAPDFYFSSAYAGGICGQGQGGSISNCYNTGDVSASASDNASSYAGGIFGFGGHATSNCYNTGDVSASASSTARAGGICGYGSGGTISNCYNTGDVSASVSYSSLGYLDSGGYAGGIWGYGDSYYSIISNCYWNSDSAQMVNGSAQTPKKGAESETDTTKPLTSAQMKMQASFAGFDFANVWEMVSGKDYPQLRGWNGNYTFGKDTYSFPNYGDTDSAGHCFGMSSTSSAYHLRLLEIAKIGGNYTQGLYALSSTATVRNPICYYQARQGSPALSATVAGGSTYRTGVPNIGSDWTEVINYVKGHAYDDKGMLQIGFRRDSEGGHAINFLYYSEVGGQPRIYAYDNNFPNEETYFYQDASGMIRQAPRSTFSGAIDCIVLRDVATYFSLVGGFDATRVIYADRDAVSIEGVSVYPMDGDIAQGEHVMYEIPAQLKQVTIIPLVDNASFEYLDKAYHFGEITDGTVGILTLSAGEGALTQEPAFTVVESNAPSKGHVLGNDKIGIGDAQLAFRAALKLVDLTAAQLAAADIDGNGRVDMSDAMRIFRYALGLSNEL